MIDDFTNIDIENDVRSAPAEITYVTSEIMIKPGTDNTIEISSTANYPVKFVRGSNYKGYMSNVISGILILGDDIIIDGTSNSVTSSAVCVNVSSYSSTTYAYGDRIYAIIKIIHLSQSDMIDGSIQNNNSKYRRGGIGLVCSNFLMNEEDAFLTNNTTTKRATNYGTAIATTIDIFVTEDKNLSPILEGYSIADEAIVETEEPDNNDDVVKIVIGAAVGILAMMIVATRFF